MRLVPSLFVTALAAAGYTVLEANPTSTSRCRERHTTSGAKSDPGDARVLAEFGDDPNRYADAKSRKNYAGTSPITRASGKSHVVLARYARNGRLADACHLWAFATLTHSPGAKA